MTNQNTLKALLIFEYKTFTYFSNISTTSKNTSTKFTIRFTNNQSKQCNWLDIK